MVNAYVILQILISQPKSWAIIPKNYKKKVLPDQKSSKCLKKGFYGILSESFAINGWAVVSFLHKKAGSEFGTRFFTWFELLNEFLSRLDDLFLMKY